MPSHKAHMRTSRRIPPLEDHDIDHEIALVNRDNSARGPEPRPLSVVTTRTNEPLSPLAPSESRAPLTQYAASPGKTSHGDEPEVGNLTGKSLKGQLPQVIEPTSDEGEEATEDQDPTGSQSKRPELNNRQPRSRPSAVNQTETAIDILYENQRGGFLCGIPLFSSAALGNLDPPPWTNFAHKTSPTDIHTAQVPDPSWDWAWPEWRVNHDDQVQMDGDGWEYSFMFSPKFSWHGPRWYNSYVRRRAWIRRRIKKDAGYQTVDDHMLNHEYFTVMAKEQRSKTLDDAKRPSLDRQSRRSYDSRRSRERSRASEDPASTVPQVKTAEALMKTLKRSRIDREKLDAVEEYITKSTDDLAPLANYMHEIMSSFVFQASRKVLLARLTKLHDDVTDEDQKGKKAAISRSQHLAEAIVHADEEVRRLEYWSDIKGMAEKGEAPRAVDDSKGWDSAWQGLDNSGAKGVRDGDELPGGGP